MQQLDRRKFLGLAGLAGGSALSIGFRPADAADPKPDSAKPWFVESFEGEPPKGWGDNLLNRHYVESPRSYRRGTWSMP